jgi:hypothetical protein
MEDDRPAEDDAVENEPDAAAESETESSETEEPPGSDQDAPGGISATTTTGDPDKDVGGPSVTEEARRKMEGDEALDEPGYGDLGHAEDFDILRDD